MPSTNRRVADAMIGASSLCAVVAGIAILSPEVRTHIVDATTGDVTGRVNAVALDAQRYAYEITDMVSFRAVDDPVVIFAGFAVFFTILMFRS